MKRTIALLLAAALLFLCGCSRLSDTIGEWFPPAKQQTGLIEIEGISENTNEIIAADFWGDELVLFADEYRKETDDYQYILYLISTKTARVKRSNYIPEANTGNFASVQFDENGNILLVNEYDGKAQRFDQSLNADGSTFDFAVEDWYEKAQENPFNTGGFSAYKDYAQYYLYNDDGAKINALTFYDDNEHLYLTDCDMLNNLDANGRIVLSQARTKSNDFITAAVYDFNTNTVVNRISSEIRPEREAYCANIGALGEKDAFLSVGYYSVNEQEEYEGNEQYYYLWHYTLDETNTPFNTVKADEAVLTQMTEEISQGIHNDYGIELLINQHNDYTEEGDDYYLHLGAPPFNVYCVVAELEAFLKNFPDGFVEEMYEDGFQIYIGKKIQSDNIGAYATGYSTVASITLATDSFTSTTLPHEFMHIIDRRIFNTFDDSNEYFEDEWAKLNPDGFEYSYDTNNYDLDEKYEDYFVSAYSTATPDEDRAEIFMNLFTAGSYDEAPYWYTESPYTKAKADYLCKAIRRAYPSLQNVDKAYWEKWVNITA